jgi:hypothetical protein
MYSGKIAVPPGGGGIVYYIKQAYVVVIHFHHQIQRYFGHQSARQLLRHLVL